MSSSDSSPSSSLDASSSKRPRKSSEPHRLAPSGEAEAAPSLPPPTVDPLALLNLASSLAALQPALQQQMAMKAALMSLVPSAPPQLDFLSSLFSSPALAEQQRMALILQQHLARQAQAAEQLRRAMSLKRPAPPEEIEEPPEEEEKDLIQVTRDSIHQRFSQIFKEEFVDLFDDLCESKAEAMEVDSISSAFRKVCPRVHDEPRFLSISPADSSPSSDSPPSPLSSSTLSSFRRLSLLHFPASSTACTIDDNDDFTQALEKKWEGRLCMRAKAVQTMWFLVGSRLPPSTPSVDQFIGQIFHPSTDPEVRISQKMRLDEKSTTDLTTKMEEGRCLSLIVVPCGETPEIVRHNQEHFHKTFIEYFSNKHVAGIAEITGVDQRVYLVHLLTPGPITTQYLPESIVSNLSKRGSDYLLAVIVAKDSINP